MSNQEKINILKAEIRSLVVSSPVGLSVRRFVREYADRIGKPFPHKEYGFEDASDLLNSMKDVVQIESTREGPILAPVRSEQIAHINELVQHQKKPQTFHRITPRKPRMKELTSHYVEDIEVFNVSKMERSKSNIGELKLRLEPEIASLMESEAVDKKEEQIEMNNVWEAFRDSGFSNATSPFPNTFSTSPFCNDDISDHLIQRFRMILQEHSEGINVHKFGAVYKNKYGYSLDYQSMGYASVRELIISLPNIFTFEKNKFSNDWILFDARINPERKGAIDSQSKWIPFFVINNMEQLVKKYPLGLRPAEALKFYQKEYGVRIDIKKLGFEHPESFFANCNSVQIKLINDDTIVFPKFNQVKNEIEQNAGLNALPPMQDLKHIWTNYFSEMVCDPTCNYERFILTDVQQLKVYVSDVHSPDAIWLQPVANTERLAKLMYELNVFYDDVEEQYTMHENVIKPGQLCCTKFSLDQRWYRSKIVEVTDMNKIKVNYVDYGTINFVSCSNLRLLHKKFIEDPVQVVRSKLHNLLPAKGGVEWPKDTNFFLFEILYQKPFYASIVDIIEETQVLSVMLIDTSNVDDINIHDVLISRDMAISSAISAVESSSSEDESPDEDTEVFGKKIWKSKYCPTFFDILQKLIPAWAVERHPHAEGYRKCFDEVVQFMDGNKENTELKTCCISHLIYSMFLTDPDNVAGIWDKIIMENIVYLYQQFLKEVSSIGPVEGRYFNLHPFCALFSPEVISNTLLKNASKESGNFYYGQTLNDKARDSIDCEMEENSSNDKAFGPTRLFPKKANGKHASLKINNLRGNCDGSEMENLLKGPNELLPYFHLANVPLKIKQCDDLNQPSPEDVSMNAKHDQQIMKKNFDLTTDTNVFKLNVEQKCLLLIMLNRCIYVSQQQILQDFTSGVPTLLLQHRTNKLVNQEENIIITASSHSATFRSLESSLLTKNGQAVLMPLANVSNYLKIITPQAHLTALSFENLSRIADYKKLVQVGIKSNQDFSDSPTEQQ